MRCSLSAPPKADQRNAKATLVRDRAGALPCGRIGRWRRSFRGAWSAHVRARRTSRCRAERASALTARAAAARRRRAALAGSADRRAVGGAAAVERGVGASRPSLEAARTARRPARARHRRLRAREHASSSSTCGGSTSSSSRPEPSLTARASLLRDALALFRGEPLSDVAAERSIAHVAAGARGKAPPGDHAADRRRPRRRRGGRVGAGARADRSPSTRSRSGRGVS